VEEEKDGVRSNSVQETQIRGYAGGEAWGDFFQGSEEISTAFEFILQGGVGIEYFFANGTALNFNYRLWHLSNSGINGRNVGTNAHVFSLGFSF